MIMERENGFTLIELLVTIVVISLLLALGVPSFKDFIKKNRLTTQSNALVSSLQLARSEAVKRGTNTVVCASSDQMTCTGSDDWDQGWIVFSDLNLNGVPDVGISDPLCEETEDCILRIGNALSGKNTITTSTASLAFSPNGLAANSGTTVTLTLVSDNCERHQARNILVTPQGHPHVTEQACP